MFPDLQRFLRHLEAHDELVRIREPVSPRLEVAALADRMVKAGAPALLFENVSGSSMPLAINLFGTPRRMAWALGVTQLDDLRTRVRDLLDVRLGGGLAGLASNLPKLGALRSLPPKRVRRAPVQTRVRRGADVDLGELPVLTCWPGDGGPFITLPLVITRDPIEGDVNVGMYRMQVFDRTTTAMHWQRHKTGARHLANARKAGERLPVAVALGGDPALTYAATAPLPPIPGIDEYALAGWLRGRSVPLVRAATVDLEVPADAEIVLEGYVDPEEPWRTEGPFGDHTGYYTLEDAYPTFHVTAITSRREPVYPTTIVGRPPMEDAAFVEASERLFLTPAQMILPELRDYHMPPAGIAHNLVNVSIEKRYPGQAYKVANGLLGLGQMMFAKVLLVTDDPEADPRDLPGFWRTVLRHALPGRDQQIAKGPIDVLDHASRAWSYGSKLVLDGTRKHAEEGGDERWSPNPERGADALPHHAEIEDQHQHAGGFWFITTRKERPGQGRHLGEWAARQRAARGVRLLMVVDDDTNPRSFDEVMWTALNNIDPERDTQVIEDLGGGGPTWVLDGTPKLEEEGFDRPWPEKIRMDPAVEAALEGRFGELLARHGATGTSEPPSVAPQRLPAPTPDETTEVGVGEAPDRERDPPERA